MVKADDDHVLVLQETPSVDVYEIEPVAIEQNGNNHYFIDFGSEIAGCFTMRASGEAGQIIKLMYGEELEEDCDRKVRYKMRCNCSYCDIWILSGMEDVLEQYDYKAFRYVEISGSTAAIDPGSFRAVVRHYPMDEKSSRFVSSDKMLNDIWKICSNGVRYGSQEAFLDCPSREKGQYLGDATITAHSHLYLSGDLRLFKKSIRDFALSAIICPGLMAVAPGSFMQEIADYSLQWPLQLLNYYWQSGDMQFLKEMYSVVKGILAYFSKNKRQDGLLENVREKRNLVDWPENMRDDYDFDLSEVIGEGCHNVINAFYCGAVKTVNEICAILGTEPAEDYEGLIKAFSAAFYREKVKLFADSAVSDHTSLHANIIPLFYGFAPAEAYESIAGLIRNKGLNCGVYNSYFLLKGLAGIGEYQLVFDLLTSREEHSWGNMLKEGASSCFEAWGKEQKWNTSLCHPWASAPIPVIIEDLIGLRPTKPDWKEYTCKPHVPDSFWFELQIHTAVGRIEVSRKKE